MKNTTVILLTGGWDESPLEQALAGAHRAAARDFLETVLRISSVDRAIVATDDEPWANTLSDLPVEIDMDPPGEPFHFGRRLAGLIDRSGAERVLYTGGASAPLFSGSRWAEVVDRLGHAQRLVITNNLHSCDWAGFVPAQEALPWLAEETNDNAIAWVLAHHAGFAAAALEPSAGTRFDLDTPIDLLIAQRHPHIRPHLRRHLDALGWRSPQLDGVLAEMAREGGSLIVAGRASSAAWQALEHHTHCWARIFAEERGMRASGRQDRGEVRSLLANYLDLVGIERFFPALGELAHAVLLDNRVILASRQLWPSTLDRFNSDLYRWEHVEEPFLQRLTRAAAEAPIPVLMGGHSVVAGGLMALTEALPSRTLDLPEGGR